MIYLHSMKILFRTLESHKFDPLCLSLYIVCLTLLQRQNQLFSLAHKLVELFPKKDFAWFAVGLYYISTKEFIEARRFLK